MKRRRPQNDAEGQFYDWASGLGYDVCKRGWPDFILERDGEIMCVEVKPRGSHPLKYDQERVLRILASYGVPCYRWSPDTGLKQVVEPMREVDRGSRSSP